MTQNRNRRTKDRLSSGDESKKKPIYLDILNKCSDVEERDLDRNSHLLISCIHEHFQGINPILVVLPQFIHLICSCILPMK